MQGKFQITEECNTGDNYTQDDKQRFTPVFLVCKRINRDDDASERNGRKFGKLCAERNIDPRSDIDGPAGRFQNRRDAPLPQLHRCNDHRRAGNTQQNTDKAERYPKAQSEQRL